MLVMIVGALFLGPTLIGGGFGNMANSISSNTEEEKDSAGFGAALGPVSMYNKDLILDDTEALPGIKSYETFSIDPYSAAVYANEQRSISLPIGDSPVMLMLEPSLVQPMVDEEKKAPCNLYSAVSCLHFSGHAQDYPDSAARVTFNDFGMSAWIRLGDAEYFVDPVKAYDSNADDGLQIVYASSDVERNLEGIEDAVPYLASSVTESNEETIMSVDEGTELPESSNQTPSRNETYVEEFRINSSDSWDIELTQQVGEDALLLSSDQTPMRIMRLLSVTDVTFSDGMGTFSYRYPATWVNIVNGWYEQVGVQIQIVDTYNWDYDNSGVYYMEDMMDILREEIQGHTSYTEYDQCNLFTGHLLYGVIGFNKGFGIIRGAGTGLFGDASKTTYGFSITVMNRDYSFPEHEEVLAHELGHALNGVHDQTDPVFLDGGGNPPPESTLMGYAEEAYWHWFSDGSSKIYHMNSQRIEYWARMNLHTILWCMDGGVYSNYPSDNIKVTSLRVMVRDLPGIADKVLDVQFDLTYEGPSTQITLDNVKTALKSPPGTTFYHDYMYNIKLKKNKPYHYASGLIDQNLNFVGVWTVTPSYFYGGHTALFSTCSAEVRRLTVIAETAVVQTGFGNSGEWAVDIDGMSNPHAEFPVKSWTFKLLAYSSPVCVGDEIFVYWGAYNADTEVFNHPEGFVTYIACQRPDLLWDDFGFEQHTHWTHSSYEGASGGGGWDDKWDGEWNPGGGYSTFLASNLMTKSGVYRIIPDIWVDYTYCAWYDATVYLTVV